MSYKGSASDSEAEPSDMRYKAGNRKASDHPVDMYFRLQPPNHMAKKKISSDRLYGEY